MSKDDRYFQGPAKLEEQIALWIRHQGSAQEPPFEGITLDHSEPFFKDLVVLFHEAAPKKIPGSLSKHAQTIREMELSLRTDLERLATRGDLSICIRVSLDLMRRLSKNPVSQAPGQAPAGSRTDPTRGDRPGAGAGPTAPPTKAHAAPGPAADSKGAAKQAHKPGAGARPPLAPGTAPAAQGTPGTQGNNATQGGKKGSLEATSQSAAAGDDYESDSFPDLGPASELDAVRRRLSNLAMLDALVGKTQLHNLAHPTTVNTEGRVPFLERILKIFDQDPNLIRILKLLGRMQDYEAQRRTKGAMPPSGELYDIQRGADLDRLVPSELAMLSIPETELDFYRRFSERLLLQYERKPEPEGKGPICLCIDQSPSMEGPKCVVAKAIGLLCIRLAAAEKRDLVAVMFSGGWVDSYKFLWRAPGVVDEVAGFLSHQLDFGTNYRLGLEECMHNMESAPFKRADILLIGDAEEDPPEEDAAFYEEFEAWLGQTQTRLYSIHIGKENLAVFDILKKLSREMLVIPNPENPDIKKLSELLNDITLIAQRF